LLGALAVRALVVAELDERDRGVGRAARRALAGDLEARRLEQALEAGRRAQPGEELLHRLLLLLLLELAAQRRLELLELAALVALLVLLVERPDLLVAHLRALLDLLAHQGVAVLPGLLGGGVERLLGGHLLERALADLVQPRRIALAGGVLEQLLLDPLVDVAHGDVASREAAGQLGRLGASRRGAGRLVGGRRAREGDERQERRGATDDATNRMHGTSWEGRRGIIAAVVPVPARDARLRHRLQVPDLLGVLADRAV